MRKFFLSYGFFLTFVAITCMDTARPAEAPAIKEEIAAAGSCLRPFTPAIRELELINLKMVPVKCKER
jgi:hypothetical protein